MRRQAQPQDRGAPGKRGSAASPPPAPRPNALGTPSPRSPLPAPVQQPQALLLRLPQPGQPPVLRVLHEAVEPLPAHLQQLRGAGGRRHGPAGEGRPTGRGGTSGHGQSEGGRRLAAPRQAQAPAPRAAPAGSAPAPLGRGSASPAPSHAPRPAPAPDQSSRGQSQRASPRHGLSLATAHIHHSSPLKPRGLFACPLKPRLPSRVLRGHREERAERRAFCALPCHVAANGEGGPERGAAAIGWRGGDVPERKAGVRFESQARGRLGRARWRRRRRRWRRWRRCRAR